MVIKNIEDLQEKVYNLIEILKDFIITNQNNHNIFNNNSINYKNDLTILSKEALELNQDIINFNIENNEYSESENKYIINEIIILKRLLNYELFKIWYLPKSITIINHSPKFKNILLSKIEEFINVVENDKYNIKQSKEMHDFLLQFKRSISNNNI